MSSTASGWFDAASLEAVESALTEAIDQWMRVPTEHMQYAHGNAQGIARALAALRGTSFTVEWSAGLDRYQDWVVSGSGAKLSAPAYQPGDVVRIVERVAVFGGQLGEVRRWDGSTYEVLIRNQSGFPWYVQLSPTQVETP